jgi:hypothetical protein
MSRPTFEPVGRLSTTVKFFVSDTAYVFSSLHTWGWLAIILGAIQVTGGVSLFGGGLYGRVIGIVAATLGAIGALLNIGGLTAAAAWDGVDAPKGRAWSDAKVFPPTG